MPTWIKFDILLGKNSLFLYISMQEVRKLAKIQQWFLETIKKAPSKVKEKEEKEMMDENKIDKEYFGKVAHA